MSLRPRLHASLPIAIVLATLGALAPTASAGKSRDRDRDGLSDRYERVRSHTNPKRRDTDRDRLSDGYEVRRSHTNPRRRDTDRDGLSDYFEVRVTRTSARAHDTDKDGLTDRYERHTSHTDPRNPDTDDDGLLDGYEVRTSSTNPLRPDTDGDGLSDGNELLLGSNPLDPNSPPPPAPADTTPPDTSITSGPSGTATTSSASFGFTSTETGSTFECRIDTGTWGACSSPKAYTNLANGSHTFEVRATDAGGNTDASPASRTWTVSVTAPPSSDSPTLQPVDGGADYYGRFSNPLPTSPDYFPIGAWFRRAETADMAKYVDFGMNLFVGIECPECTDEATIRQSGMRSLIYIGERTRFNDLGAEVAGWQLADEVDMTSGPGNPSTKTGAGYDVMRNANNSAPADGRARYANYGKGVYMWETDAQAEVFINEFQSLTSLDMYWHTDPNEKSRPEYGSSAGYGKTVDRMRFLDGLDGQRKPMWNFVETGWPWTEDPAQHGGRIQPAEARAAVWHSIIAGARGIIYFDHQFGGTCTNSVIRGECYLDTKAALKSTNEQIKRLARVLNSPTVTSGHSSSSGIRTLVKWDGSNFYVLAGSTGGASTGQVDLPCVGNATATVVDENRTVPVTGGTFSDQFANGNSIHIYRIDNGSTCGLGPA